jgi:hypothetical protein
MDTSQARMREAAQAQGLPITPHKLTPEIEDSFWVNLIGKGYPAPRLKFRWCTERLKIKPSNKFIRGRAQQRRGDPRPRHAQGRECDPGRQHGPALRRRRRLVAISDQFNADDRPEALEVRHVMRQYAGNSVSEASGHDVCIVNLLAGRNPVLHKGQ